MACEVTEEYSDSWDSDQDVSSAVTSVGQDSPRIGDVVINDSTDIHVGNKTYYNGNVTIKQIVYGHDKGDLESDSPKVATDEIFNVIYNSKFNAEHAPQSDGKTASKNEYGIFNQGFHCTNLGLRAVLLTGLLALILLLLLLSIRVFFSSQLNGTASPSERTSPRSPSVDSISTEGSVLKSDALHMVPRNKWKAESPTDVPIPFKVSPVPFVIIEHTETKNCTTSSTCEEIVKNIQDFQMMSKDLDDIGYNFLVGGDGYVYIGRGWDFVGVHTPGYNNISIGVAFIGRFTNFLPPEKQIKAAKMLIKDGIELNNIALNYKLFGQCELSSTDDSPGKKLYQNIQTWPHWSPTV